MWPIFFARQTLDTRWARSISFKDFMKHMNPTVVILRELLYCRGRHSPISIGKQLWSISTVEVRTPGVSGPPSVYFGHIELSLTFAPCIGFGGGRLEMGLLRNLDRNLKQLDNVQ